MVHPSFQPYLPEVIEIFKKHKIISAFLFGSVLTDSFCDKSDVDFLVNIENDLDPVEAGGHLWDVYYELKDLLNREVGCTN